VDQKNLGQQKKPCEPERKKRKRGRGKKRTVFLDSGKKKVKWGKCVQKAEGGKPLGGGKYGRYKATWMQGKRGRALGLIRRGEGKTQK